MSDIRSRLARGALWLTVTRFGLNILGFLSTVVLARLLSPQDFGLVAIATSLLVIIQAITDLSLASALVHRSDLREDHFHSVFTISLMRAAAIFLVFAASAWPISRFYRDERLFSVLLVVGVTGALSGLTNPKLIILQRALVFRQEFIVQLSKKGVAFLITVGIAIVYRTYWAIIIGGLFGAAVSLAWSYTLVPYRPKLKLTDFKELFAYSFWLSMGNMINSLNWKFDQLVLGHFVPKAQLGLYNMADNISALPTREATAPIVGTLFPAFSRLSGDPERLRAAYRKAQAATVAVAFPIGFGFAATAHLILRMLLGAKWTPAVPIAEVLAGTFAFQTLSNGLQPLAMAKGETKILFGRDVRTLLIRIPFVVAGLFYGGLMGVVIGRAISSALGTLINTELVKRLSGITVWSQITMNVRTFAATGAMLFTVLAVDRVYHLRPPTGDWQRLAAEIVGGAMAYGITLLTLWYLQGRPGGAETELYAAVTSALSRARIRQS